MKVTFWGTVGYITWLVIFFLVVDFIVGNILAVF